MKPGAPRTVRASQLDSRVSARRPQGESLGFRVLGCRAVRFKVVGFRVLTLNPKPKALNPRV